MWSIKFIIVRLIIRIREIYILNRNVNVSNNLFKYICILSRNFYYMYLIIIFIFN